MKHCRMKNRNIYLLKLNISTSLNSITFLDTCPRETLTHMPGNMSKNLHSTTVYNSKKKEKEKAKPLTKINHRYYSGILHSNEKQVY